MRNWILAALFAALTGAGALLRIPLGDSAFTLQVLFTCLAGLLLGPRHGALSQLLYLLLGLAGLPVFAGGGGVGAVLSPTFGFVLGLPPMAWVIGRLSAGSVRPARAAAACLAGLAVLYLAGVPYMYVILHAYLGKGLPLSRLCCLYVLPFLPFDCVKIAAAVQVAAAVGPRCRPFPSAPRPGGGGKDEFSA